MLLTEENMAETGENKPAKKRQLKKVETVRQRVERGDTAQPKRRHVKKAAGKLSLPFRLLWKVVRFIARPFAFLLIPFKTKPARFVGRVLAKVFLLSFFKESWQELRQVKWPTARETTRLTIAVFIFSLVFGTIIALTDYGLGKVFKAIFID